MSVTDKAAEVNDLAYRSLLRLRALRSAAARKRHAARLLGVINNADVALRRELSSREGQVVPVLAYPPFVTLTQTVINEVSIMAAPYASRLAETVETGAVTVDDGDALIWITTFALTLLAGLAVFFGAPVLAIIAGIGAALTAILATMDDLVSGGGDSPLSTSISSLTGLLVVGAVAYWLLIRRNT